MIVINFQHLGLNSKVNCITDYFRKQCTCDLNTTAGC
jgi:hypothetical protein